MRRIAATEKCAIIFGHCGNYILRDRPNVLKVYVHAPEQTCIRTVMNMFSLDRDEAERRIHEIDKKRAEYYRHFTGRDWQCADDYDLCIDSSRMSWDKCIHVVKAYLDSM